MHLKEAHSLLIPPTMAGLKVGISYPARTLVRARVLPTFMKHRVSAPLASDQKSHIWLLSKLDNPWTITTLYQAPLTIVPLKLQSCCFIPLTLSSMFSLLFPNPWAGLAAEQRNTCFPSQYIFVTSTWRPLYNHSGGMLQWKFATVQGHFP